jgi:hypothetical protein
MSAILAAHSDLLRYIKDTDTTLANKEEAYGWLETISEQAYLDREIVYMVRGKPLDEVCAVDLLAEFRASLDRDFSYHSDITDESEYAQVLYYEIIRRMEK